LRQGKKTLLTFSRKYRGKSKTGKEVYKPSRSFLKFTHRHLDKEEPSSREIKRGKQTLQETDEIFFQRSPLAGGIATKEISRKTSERG